MKKKNQQKKTQNNQRYSDTSRLVSLARRIIYYCSTRLPAGRDPKSWIPAFAGMTNILLFLFILLLPTQLGKHFFFSFSYLSGVRIDYLAPTLYLTDIIALAIILLNIKSVITFFSNKISLLFFLLLAVNVYFALSQPIALYKALKIVELLSIFAVMRHVKIPTSHVIIAFLIGASVELFLAVTQFSLKHSVQSIFYFLGERAFTLSTPDIAKASLSGIEILRPYGTFSHPNSMAGFYLLVYIYSITREKISPYLKYGLATISTLLVFISFSKVAITTYAIVTVWYLLKNKLYKKCALCFTARIISLFTIAGVFFLAKGDVLSGEKRLTLAQDALSITKDHLLTGTGLGNYVIAQHEFIMRYPYFFLQPVHNIFLLLFSEGGIFFGLFILSLGANYIRARWNYNVMNYFLLAFFITGMFDHYWLTLQQNVLLIPLLFGFVEQD